MKPKIHLNELGGGQVLALVAPFTSVTGCHIQKVEVFTGDDNYNETDCVEITANKGQNLDIQQSLKPYHRSSPYRIRHEPGVRLFVSSEEGHQFMISITHHKGDIHVDTELYSKYDIPMVPTDEEATS